MTRPVNEFGGWLRFFQVTSWLSVALCAAGALVSGLAIFGAGSGREALGFAVVTADLGLTAWLGYLMVGRLKDRAPGTPAEVRRLIGWIAGLTAVFLALEAGAALWAQNGQWTDADTASAKGSVQTLIWCAVWTSYFTRSKRVAAYYIGDAAPPLSPSSGAHPPAAGV